MSAEEQYDYENKGRTKRRIIGGFVAFVLVCIGAITYIAAYAETKPTAPKPKQGTVVVVYVPPPKTQPLPSQVEPTPPSEVERMIEQTPVEIHEVPPETAPSEDTSPDLTTGIVGEGSNGFGDLSTGGGGGGEPKPIVCKGIGGSRYGWYAARVQNTISSALRNNSSTRSATLTLNVKIWADRSGRVTRAQLIGSTGRSDIDEIIRNQILVGIQLTDPPPADMPMPINLRITARKP